MGMGSTVCPVADSTSMPPALVAMSTKLLRLLSRVTERYISPEWVDACSTSSALGFSPPILRSHYSGRLLRCLLLGFDHYDPARLSPASCEHLRLDRRPGGRPT